MLKVILRVSVEGYSEGVCWRLFWECLLKVILRVSVEGYSESVCWRLFSGCLLKVILRVSVECYSESVCWRLFSGCLLKVIPETQRMYYISYLRFSNVLTSLSCVPYVDCLSGLSIFDFRRCSPVSTAL